MLITILKSKLVIRHTFWYKNLNIINLDQSHLLKFLEHHFWHTNSLVREYDYKERPEVAKIGVIPQREFHIAKN